MEIKIVGDVAVIYCSEPVITDGQSALDLIASIFYEHEISKFAINKAAICEDFLVCPQV